MLYKLTILIFFLILADSSFALDKNLDSILLLSNTSKVKNALSLNEKHCQTLKLTQSELLAECLSTSGQLLVALADYQKPEIMFKRSLMLRENFYGKKHLMFASSLNDLGELYRHRGEYKKPEKLYQSALAIRLKKLNPQHPLIAEIYKNLAELYHDQGHYKDAEWYYLKAIDILSKLNKSTQNTNINKLALAEVQTWLAMLYQEQNMLVEAEALYQLGIAERHSILSMNHPFTIDSILGLASLYAAKGDYRLSLSLVLESQLILQKMGYNKHPDYAQVLSLLASIYSNLGLTDKNKSLYQQVLTIYKRTYGDNNIMTAYAYSNLGWLLTEQHEFSTAKIYFKKALQIRINTLSHQHQEVADSQKALANLAIIQGQYNKAETLLLDALSIYNETLGANSIAKSNTLFILSKLHWKRDELNKAIDLMSQAAHIQELEIKRYLNSGSERQKIAYMNTLSNQNDFIVSLHMQGDTRSKNAAELSLTTILQRKGRVIDVLLEHDIKKILPTLSTGMKKVIVNWQQSRQQLAKLSLRKPSALSNKQYALKLLNLRSNVDIKQSLLETLTRKLNKVNVQKSVSIAAISKAIPKDYVLLEFFIYYPFIVNSSSGKPQWGKKSLAAYTLDYNGKINSRNLGELSKIKKLFNAARRKLSTPINSIDLVNQSLRKLDEVLFTPLIPLIGNVKNILIAPDGFLNLLPFSTLVDQQGNYRVDEFQFTYLTSGRDLISLSINKHKQQKLGPVMIVANPSFDNQKIETDKDSMQLATTRSLRLGDLKFKPLPNTEIEAQALKQLIPSAQILLAKQASEYQLKSIQSPQILHIATHGFFLSNHSKNAWNVERHPLLRSGLALSGANLIQKDAKEDGILTALELAEMNLAGTELVVLSACDTGLGITEDGHGVYGLRRALVVAGSQSQLLSLWQVNDNVTQKLMVQYYKNLLHHQARSEAIRNARKIIREQYPHPFYWSSFIASGDWRTLSNRFRSP